jgi:predicted O-methyltransferase YrrM
MHTLYFIYNSRQRRLKRLQTRNYSSILLDDTSEDIVRTVRTCAEKIHKDNNLGWNYYSNALRREVVETFAKSVLAVTGLFGKVNYLEIGSAQGLSMSLIGLMLKAKDKLSQLTSIDPYFDAGYREGSSGPWNKEYQVKITKLTKQYAFDLYQSLKIDVELLEVPSSEGLRSLLKANRKYHIIYIDGSHEYLNPIIDFGLSCALLHTGGIIMLDDHHWPDVQVIKSLCDKHCKKIHECWKVASYTIEKDNE